MLLRDKGLIALNVFLFQTDKEGLQKNNGSTIAVELGKNKVSVILGRGEGGL